jgi:hypothetical protein
MTTPFARSIRILDADKFRPSLLIIGLTLGVLVAWLLWFFLARVTLLEMGNITNLGTTGEVQTEFMGQTAKRVRVGQPGWIRLNGDLGSTLGLVPVVVVRKHPPNGSVTTFDVIVQDEDFFTTLLTSDLQEEPPFGRVQIEVERVSPATLLLRSSGQFVDAPFVSTSPQSEPVNK